MNEIATILEIKNNGIIKFKTNNGNIQLGQVFYPYGFFGNIKITKNSLVLVFYVDGGRDYPLAMPINIIKQPTSIGSGNIQAGGFDNETKILITDNQITINATQIEINGNLKVNGNAIITGNANISNKDFLTHSHSGVSSGSANSGPVS
jgi:hypothetical protein